MDSLLLIKLKLKMKTQFTTLGDFSPSYPVGTHMLAAMKFAKKAYQTLINYCPNLHTESSIVIWCRGSSGAILGALLAQHLITNESFRKMEIRVNHVKKEGESSHSSPETYCDTFFNIVIDDIIASGSTLKAIIDYIDNDKEHPRKKEQFKLDALIIGGSIPARYTNIWRTFDYIICESFALDCNKYAERRQLCLI